MKNITKKKKVRVLKRKVLKRKFDYTFLYLNKNIRIGFRSILTFIHSYIKRKPNLKNSFLFNLLANLQNLYFRKKIPKLLHKNKIFVIGNMRQLLPVLKELKKSPNNLIIRAGENVGRGFFNRYADFYVTFKRFLNYKTKGDRLDYYKNIMRELKSKVDVVIVDNDILPFERTIIQTANKLDIPTLTFVDGLIPDKIVKKGESDFFKLVASKIVLFSEYQKKQFLKNNIAENRLEVTGYPLFDEYFNSNPKIKKREFYKKYDIPVNNRIVLFAEEYHSRDKREYNSIIISPEQHKKRYFELFKAMKGISDLYLLIKPHPSGFLGNSFVKNIADDVGFNKFKIVNDFDIYSLINASEIVITRFSTMALEAMILKKFVIVFDTYTRTFDYLEYTKYGSALNIKKPGELKTALFNLLNDKSIQKKLKYKMKKFININHINDGKASKRVANLIEKMIKYKKRK